ncbi:hypothetical protein [Stutzerimonas chloritidismutans]|uniref:hypothetical protein n=1 Tax=Stutzerimonas chloritidismutans TaxID=203192 RepID=UPI003F5CD064
METAVFFEAAPACFSNLQAAIPSVWTAFDSAWLIILRSTVQVRVGPPPLKPQCAAFL